MKWDKIVQTSCEAKEMVGLLSLISALINDFRLSSNCVSLSTCCVEREKERREDRREERRE
jgi:hypothetical protein